MGKLLPNILIGIVIIGQSLFGETEGYRESVSYINPAEDHWSNNYITYQCKRIVKIDYESHKNNLHTARDVTGYFGYKENDDLESMTKADKQAKALAIELNKISNKFYNTNILISHDYCITSIDYENNIKPKKDIDTEPIDFAEYFKNAPDDKLLK
ncbi:hypothetical protein LS68_000395 [Helicobacter sp. MIT 05-5293]|uniref:hypothetical protein n=1 Tax=Helicobacter sp. MIT 05-5293 TaxID=1548149 RepID=UPI00051CF01D|nr:hypothetical protein [Helicobacter sp. MIT 05-5293]TLD81539.1 hypothetical protein LS68_000395 [Helicobacter sp. MIT 05-5293]